MGKDKTLFTTILPVMFGFFIMGFVDLVGICTNYIKTDFGMSDSLVSLISVSCFIWFFLLSIPTGFLMNRYGRKNVVLWSFLVSFAAMMLPLFFGKSFAGYIIAFALLGIGNTLLQVGMNPLVSEVVSPDKLTGTINLGQFVKAVCSFLAPIIAAACVGTAFGWRLIFPIYAAISLLATLWLWLSPVKSEPVLDAQTASFGRTFSLLADKTILLFFIAILVLVGVDVGMGVSFPKLLMEKCGFDVADAGLGNSAYFLARTVGAFCGGIILMKINEKRFYLVSIAVAALGLAGMFVAKAPWLLVACVAVFGLGYSNLFGIIFSLGLKHMPEKANEVSALLVTGVAGGALITPVLGLVTDMTHTQLAAIAVLLIFWMYMLSIYGTVSKTSSK
ncbi:MAG: MFS transporter [Bacteroidales bacterium]|nr:MFS transporter [Bacteroidales bacterium]